MPRIPPWADVHAQAAALRRAVARAGCELTSISTIGEYVRGEIRCPSGWHGARLLEALTDEDAMTPGAQRMAQAIARDAQGDALAFTRRVFSMAQGLGFYREPGEQFLAGSYTLHVGGGDCDDHARLVCALLKAAGIPARMVFLHREGADPSHVVTQANVGGAWRWLETTVSARFDEPPLAAAKRLGLLKKRADLSKHASVLNAEGRPQMLGSIAALTLSGVLLTLSPEEIAKVEHRYNTGDLSPGFFRGVAAMARRFNMKGASISGEDLLAVFQAESGIQARAHGHPVINGVEVHGRGLNQIIGDGGLRFVGWTGTGDEYLALSAEEQLPYVERYFNGQIPPQIWPYVSSARALYLANGLPKFVPLSRFGERILARKGDRTGWYEGLANLDYRHRGVIDVSDFGAFLVRQAQGPRWEEARARYWLESGDVPVRPVDIVKGAAVVGLAAAAAGVVLYLAHGA